MRRIHQTTVEHQIAGDVGIEITVVVTAADAQRFAQCHQVFIGAAQRRQANGFDFQDVPGLPRLLMGAAGQGFHGVQGVNDCPQIAAVALADLDQTGKRQHTHGFTHGVAADTQLGRQLRFGGQALADGPGACIDALAQLVQRLIDQGSFD
ncbi:hypothetical protein D3C87_1500460 [compost metagenome]